MATILKYENYRADLKMRVKEFKNAYASAHLEHEEDIRFFEERRLSLWEEKQEYEKTMRELKADFEKKGQRLGLSDLILK